MLSPYHDVVYEDWFRIDSRKLKIYVMAVTSLLVVCLPIAAATLFSFFRVFCVKLCVSVTKI